MGGPWRPIYGVRHRANRLEAGLCDKCQNPPAPGRLSCEAHLKEARERQQQRRAQERMSERWQARQTQKPPRPTPVERIMAKVAFEPNTGCWLWLGKTVGNGYGWFWLNRKGVLSHRAAYELTVGPIPTGLDLDHKCRVTCCVNPAHLEPVTTKINGARVAIARTLCKRGHPFDKRNTRLAFNKTLGRWARQCRKCACLKSREYARQRRAKCA